MSFYFAGGTLRSDAPSYVDRLADQQLLDGLLAGRFCYVLTARQMGKSSLMVRTVTRLRDAAVTVAVLDLTAIGQNLNPDQWYGGLLTQLGQRLDLEDELVSFWQSHRMLGPLQRWITMVRDVVLPHYPGRIVIFIDEIDVVRSLPFSVDEFFAGIRECYNERNQVPAMERLSFGLLGVAAPTDLVKDTRLTPFNIGQRIELHDFTEHEAAPLARGLGHDDRSAMAILKRILYWTGGHPYLTQRLCQAVAEGSKANGRWSVDRMCRDLFLSVRAHERDDNLLFVRERMLRSEVDLVSLLDLYRQIRGRHRVSDDESNSLLSTLLLSGIVRAEQGYVKVRNRIYERVFDHKWIEASMPEAELRRQRQAYRRGVWRTAAISAVILAAISILSVVTFVQLRTKQQLLYYSQMRMAKEKWETGEFDRVTELLQDTTPKIWQQDLRGFEWYLFRDLTRTNEVFALNEPYPVVAVRLSSSGDLLRIGEVLPISESGNREYALKLFDWTRNQELHSFKVYSDNTYSNSNVVFTPNQKHAITDGPDNTAILWDFDGGGRLAAFKAQSDRLSVFTLSPNGALLAMAEGKGTIEFWNVSPQKFLFTLKGEPQRITSLMFSPNGDYLAAAYESERISLWNIRRHQAMLPIVDDEDVLTSAVFFPDNRRLLATTKEGKLKVWDVSVGNRIAMVDAHIGPIRCIAFSHDGERFATGGNDRTVKLWSAQTLHQQTTIKGLDSVIRSIAWSMDGHYLATGSQDSGVKVWDVNTEHEPFLPSEHVSEYFATFFSPAKQLWAAGRTEAKKIKIWNFSSWKEVFLADDPDQNTMCAAFSPDGRVLATGGLDSRIRLWSVATGREIKSLPDDTPGIFGIGFSPDGKLLVSGDKDRVRLWNVDTGAQIRSFIHAAKFWRPVFSPDGTYLAYVDPNSDVVLWNVLSQEIEHTLKGTGKDIQVIAFSPDGELLATAGENAQVTLWKSTTGEKLRPLGIAHSVQRTAFSPDGKRLITGSTDGAIKVWDILAGQELMNLPGHNDEVTSVTFSADGTSLATSGNDGTVRLWRTYPEQKSLYQASVQ